MGKRPKSDQHVAGAVRSMIGALGRRCAEADPSTAVYLLALRDALDLALVEAIEGWRKSGFTDAEIGRELGVTRQAVQKRAPREH